MFGTLARAQDRRTTAMPDRFEIGRHTFIDIGPPFDFYELFFVRPAGSGSSIDKILLTPAGAACLQPAKIEIASAVLKDSVKDLLDSYNPCTIPQRELRRELKRCKKCPVFSGADVAMRVQCGANTRVLRSAVLDRDLFDQHPGTPKHTLQTMELLAKLDRVVGLQPLDQPMFATGAPNALEAGDPKPASPELADVAAGKYDSLFKDASPKPSEVYHAAQIKPPSPTIKLLASIPAPLSVFVEPEYPQMARIAHIEGNVLLKLEIAPTGAVKDAVCASGHPLLCAAAKRVTPEWVFSAETANHQEEVILEFRLNCLIEIQQTG
jgi:TonB-like protein